jgi:hypothetical protein
MASAAAAKKCPRPWAGPRPSRRAAGTPRAPARSAAASGPALRRPAGGGESSQLVVDEREQLGGGPRVASLDRGQDLGDVSHERHPTTNRFQKPFGDTGSRCGSSGGRLWKARFNAGEYVRIQASSSEHHRACTARDSGNRTGRAGVGCRVRRGRRVCRRYPGRTACGGSRRERCFDAWAGLPSTVEEFDNARRSGTAPGTHRGRAETALEIRRYRSPRLSRAGGI